MKTFALPFIFILLFVYGCKSKQEKELNSNLSRDKIAFVSKDKLCVVDADGQNFKIIKDSLSGYLFSWSKDGSSLNLIVKGELLTIDTNGKIRQSVDPKITGFCYPIIFSDSLLIVEGFLDTASVKEMQLFIMGNDGNIIKTITDGSKRTINPTLSPDRTKIAYTQADSVGYEIYVQNIDSPYMKQNLTNDTLMNKFPSWSPNGDYIAYLQEDRQGRSIWVMSVNGQDKKKITTDLGAEIASWSPNSEKIVVSYFGEEGQLAIINIFDTTKKSFIKIDSIGSAYFPVWSPN